MLTIENLVKTFPAGKKEGSSGVLAVDDLSLSVQEGKLSPFSGRPDAARRRHFVVFLGSSSQIPARSPWVTARCFPPRGV